MTNFLEETGNIAHKMPKEARELASFMALVVDETTKLLLTRLYIPDALNKVVKELHVSKYFAQPMKFAGLNIFVFRESIL